MAIKDPNRRKAWVEGSWDVTSGGRFDHLWNASLTSLSRSAYLIAGQLTAPTTGASRSRSLTSGGHAPMAPPRAA
jgi:hypothetical protein